MDTPAQRSREPLEWAERTDALALKLGLRSRDLASAIGICPSTLFAGRSGKKPISRKSWLKLEALEAAHAPAPASDPPRDARGEKVLTIGNVARAADAVGRGMDALLELIGEEVKLTGLLADEVVALNARVAALEANQPAPAQ
jgi:hypothetical protein